MKCYKHYKNIEMEDILEEKNNGNFSEVPIIYRSIFTPECYQRIVLDVDYTQGTLHCMLTI